MEHISFCLKLSGINPVTVSSGRVNKMTVNNIDKYYIKDTGNCPVYVEHATRVAIDFSTSSSKYRSFVGVPSFINH